jgi:ABC-type branched-subunit amino acid transport system substrate-binding protein
LLPLSGRLADIGTPMLRAAQLALSVPGSPVLEVKDTGGTPDGAALAASEAIADGAKMILGPLTSPETAQVAPIARQAGVPVLAFTNDHGQAQPGVWVLGITPGQQVRRLLGEARETGHVPVAALLPDDDFGKAMADELIRVAVAEGQPPPYVRMVGPGAENITAAVTELASSAGQDQPFPFGAILLGATGPDLKAYAQAFAEAKIDRSKVQIMGPGLWIDPASGSSAMIGGWFAVPDPDSRRDLIRDYSAQYKESPPPRADLASDAAAIARVLAGQGRMNAAGLTQPVGFTGVDGWFVLLPDGQVRRGLAVFRVDRGRAVKVSDAPAGPGPGGGVPGG